MTDPGIETTGVPLGVGAGSKVVKPVSSWERDCSGDCGVTIVVTSKTYEGPVFCEKCSQTQEHLDRGFLLENLNEDKVKRLIMDKFMMPVLTQQDLSGEPIKLTWEESCWLLQIILRVLNWEVT